MDKGEEDGHHEHEEENRPKNAENVLVCQSIELTGHIHREIWYQYVGEPLFKTHDQVSLLWIHITSGETRHRRTGFLKQLFN